jgi:uncharacterized membrane protein YphA (DoxX/SURF4 family)
MKTGMLVARIFLGGIFVISGLNGFFHFIPSTAMPGSPMAFLSSMVSTGDFFYVIKFFEIILGTMMLAGIFMPIVLIMMFPISMNIFMFHMTTGHGGIPMAMIMIIAHIYMLYMHREKYVHMIHG